MCTVKVLQLLARVRIADSKHMLNPTALFAGLKLKLKKLSWSMRSPQHKNSKSTQMKSR